MKRDPDPAGMSTPTGPAAPPAPSGGAGSCGAGGGRGALAVILAAYVLVQVWVVTRAVAPARDGARYLSYALLLDSESWREVFRTRPDHPGYPLFLHGVLR